jgi:hypothetical protein
VIGLTGAIPVAGEFGASATFRFTAPMNREAVEKAVTAMLGGDVRRLTWADDDREVRADFVLVPGQTVTLKPDGLPDRWGRPAGPGPSLVLKGVPMAAVRHLTYIPETDEAHPFTGDQMPDVFVEGLPSERNLLLWAMNETGHGVGPEYKPFLVVEGKIKALPLSLVQTQPRFYGWMRDQQGVVVAGDGEVIAYDLTGKELRRFSRAGALHGGAVSGKSGLVALLVSSDQDNQVRLVVWNPETGEQQDYGPIEPRRGERGLDFFAWQWVDADWAPDDSEIALAAYLPGSKPGATLYRFTLATGQLKPVAEGYKAPHFSPAGTGLLLAERTAPGENSVILSPDGKVQHELPGQGWVWHRSGQALDRGMGTNCEAAIQNYRLSDHRLMERGRGVVLGHIDGPGSSSLVTLTCVR